MTILRGALSFSFSFSFSFSLSLSLSSVHNLLLSQLSSTNLLYSKLQISKSYRIQTQKLLNQELCGRSYAHLNFSVVAAIFVALMLVQKQQALHCFSKLFPFLLCVRDDSNFLSSIARKGKISLLSFQSYFQKEYFKQFMPIII